MANDLEQAISLINQLSTALAFVGGIASTAVTMFVRNVIVRTKRDAAIEHTEANLQAGLTEVETDMAQFENRVNTRLDAMQKDIVEVKVAVARLAPRGRAGG